MEVPDKIMYEPHQQVDASKTDHIAPIQSVIDWEVVFPDVRDGTAGK